MAMIGASIGLTFALSLVISPWLNSLIGVPGIFMLMAIFSFIAVLIIKYLIQEPAEIKKSASLSWQDVGIILRRFDLNRLNFGIFVLHATQISMFMAVPFYLINQGQLPLDQHWTIYLPVLVLSFICIVPMIIFSERQGKTKQSFLFSILLLLFAQFLFVYLSDDIIGIAISLLIYFVGFNYLEASLPSLVSKLAPLDQRGLSLGVYNTSQSLGLFLGGFVGGLIANYFGYQGTFFFCGLLVLIWFILSLTMKMPERKKK
jgi:predicted MFS family arabinose efflux permease